MTPVELAKVKELIELSEKATPGPWRQRGEDVYPEFHWVSSEKESAWQPEHFGARITGGNRINNAKFIVSARTIIPALTSLLAAYEGLVKEREIPEGYQIVPVEPTLEMEKAGNAVHVAGVTGYHGHVGEIYSAMLEAATLGESK